MPEPEIIKGLERGLKVLHLMQSHAVWSLQDIYLATRISKPSLLRILNTLERAGVVSRRLVDGHYRMSGLNRLGRKRDRYDQVAEAAAPVLDRLCQKVLWPSDLLVPAGDHMDRRESSRPRSPFVTHSPYVMNRVGQPVGWLLTGVGRAYLSFCPERERESILGRLRKSRKPEDRLANDQKKLDKIFAETRQRGYATRDRIFVGGTYGNPPMNDGLAAIAVPLLDRERVHGSINILWIKTAFTIEEFASRHLSDLQGAAEEIVSALRSSKQSRRRPARGFVEN